MRALYLGERPLAMLINFLCPPGGFSFKTAFDEEYARFSPGVLLQQANLDLLGDDRIDWVDSCAAPDHPMIESAWRERSRLLRVNAPLAGGAAQVRFTTGPAALRGRVSLSVLFLFFVVSFNKYLHFHSFFLYLFII